jgi:putative superfamily III holin-X
MLDSQRAADGKRPLSEIVRAVIDGVRDILRKEIELAKIEVTEAITSKGVAIGLLAAGGVAALYGVGFAAAAGSSALDLVMPTWAADLIVGAVFLVVAAVAVLAGRRMLRRGAMSPKRTKETVKEDVRWAKQQIER